MENKPRSIRIWKETQWAKSTFRIYISVINIFAHMCLAKCHYRVVKRVLGWSYERAAWIWKTSNYFQRSSPGTIDLSMFCIKIPSYRHLWNVEDNGGFWGWLGRSPGVAVFPPLNSISFSVTPFHWAVSVSDVKSIAWKRAFVWKSLQWTPVHCWV